MEEHRYGCSDTIGNKVAIRHGVDWRNVGTPERLEFKTNVCQKDLMVLPPIYIPDHGPIEDQIRRENYMIAEIEKAMAGRTVGLMICGTAHLHSLAEKLHRRGFKQVVIGFGQFPSEWTFSAPSAELETAKWVRVLFGYANCALEVADITTAEDNLLAANADVLSFPSIWDYPAASAAVTMESFSNAVENQEQSCLLQ